MRPFFNRSLLYGLLILIGLGSALPSLLSNSALDNLPGWYSDNQLALGLDLQGGSQLTMAIDSQDLLSTSHQQLLGDIVEESELTDIQIKETAVSEKNIVIHTATNAGARSLEPLINNLIRQTNSNTISHRIDVSNTRVELTANNAYQQQLISNALEKSDRVVRQRMNESGVVEPSIFRQGEDRLVIQMPGETNPERVRELLGSTARLSFHWLAKSRYSTAAQEFKGQAAGEIYTLEKRAAFEGEHVRHAFSSFDSITQEPIVIFQLDKTGAKEFARMTKRNIGRQLAIVLDDRVISAPQINTVIAGGSGEISGAFTTAQTSDLALVLRSGALPAKLVEVERYTVGPQLGSDAITAGLFTGLLGALLVVGFMLFSYRRWGLIACGGLTVVMVFIFSILGFLRATLTLPGIAGLILTMGMAVDANILINERIREEVNRGKKIFSAVQEGYRQAFATILDANITTLIAVVLLFLVGNGPVRGFAIIIAIGIAATLLTTVIFTRPMMEAVVRRFPASQFLSGKSFFAKLLPNRQSLDFMRTRFLGLVVSLVLSLGSIVLLATEGLSIGVDFSGGSAIKVHHSNLDIDQIRQVVGSEHQIQSLGGESSYLVRLNASNESKVGAADTLRDQISAFAPLAEFDISSISAQVSSEFFSMGLMALLIASLGVVVYLWARYENYFAGAAITTLVLDLTKTLGFFVVSGIEFNLTSVAALLALIGYSINDKVVVFDRIRENIRLHREPDLHKLINNSIRATLSRTLLTSASTIIAILPMAIAGGSVVANFATPLLFGIVISTSSSIFVAAPLILHFGKKRLQNNESLVQKTNDEIRQEIV